MYNEDAKIYFIRALPHLCLGLNECCASTKKVKLYGTMFRLPVLDFENGFLVALEGLCLLPRMYHRFHGTSLIIRKEKQF